MNRHQRPRQAFGYRDRGRNHFEVRNAEREAHLSLQRVNELVGKENDEILLGLIKPSFNFNQYMEAPRLGDDMVNSLADLIAKAFSCNAMRSQVTKLIPVVAKSNFLNKIVYLSLEKKSPANLYNIKLIRSVISILRVIFEIDQKLFSLVAPLRDRIEILVKVRTNDPELTKEFDESVSLMNRLAAKQVESEQYKTFKNMVDVDPPENFIYMNIVPKLNDIVCNDETFLRRNITNVTYKNVSHYLDVQFRLLREDFLCPVCSIGSISHPPFL